jgi:transposase
MGRNKYRGSNSYPFRTGFNPKPKKIFRFKTEKILGSLYLTRPLLERMQIKAIIDNIIPLRKENGQIVTTGEVSEVLVANRLHHPRPLNDIEGWAEVSGIEELYGLNPEHLNDDRLGRALEDLEQYFEEIITALSLHVITEFGLNPEEILWDTTSIYFEGDYDNSEILRFGYGEKPDLKQLKLSLNVEKASGIPLRADIFDGNRADVAIVVENLKKLRRTLKKEDLLFTGDNAMGTIPNCLKLNSNKIRFIAPSPASSLFEETFASVTEEELNLLVFPDKDGSAKFKVVERGVFINHPDLDKNPELKGLKPFWARCLIIWSKSRAKLNKEKREKYIKALKERLTDIAATKLNHRRYKDKNYAQKQVDKCFEGPQQYLRKAFGYPQIIEKDGCFELSYALNNELLEKLEQKDGLYPVVTNVYDQGYTTEELFLRTRRKYSVEQPIRHLKSKIKIRPMFLHIDERIRGLALVTFIALMAYCILEHLAKQNLDPKATTNLLMKEFAAIVFSVGEMLDGTPFHTVGNVKERHIRLINKLGLAIGSYAAISEVQLE